MSSFFWLDDAGARLKTDPNIPQEAEGRIFNERSKRSSDQEDHPEMGLQKM